MRQRDRTHLRQAHTQLEVFVFHSPADRGVAATIAERLKVLAGAQVRLEQCGSGDTVEDVWDQGLGSSAILLLLSPASVPAVGTREKWPAILKHRELNALPPLGLIQIAPCKFPQVLERKHFFRYTDNPQRALRDLTQWISNLPGRTEPFFSPARLPWFQGRAAELDQMWESLVDEAGVTILANPASGSGKTALAQEFVRATGSHFRDVLWIECGRRTEISIAGELAAHLGVSLGNHGEDAFARIGALIQERRVLLVLDDVADGLSVATAGGGRASVLVTTKSEEQARLPGATIIQLEPVALPAPDSGALTPAASQLWNAIRACRPQGFPLELATRIARLDEAEAQQARRSLEDQRWIDPVDAAGSRYRLGAGAHNARNPQPASEAFHRWHAEALIETFSKWGSQPGPCRSLLTEMDAGFQWALRSNWKLATQLGHRACGFLNQEGRPAEAIQLYSQLLRAARERNDACEIEHCVRELSWTGDQKENPRRTTTNAEQTAFDFTG